MSPDEESHNETLRAVLNKLFGAGLKLNTNKCKFFTDKVEYLGYVFDRDEVHLSDAKISAIVNAPVPKDLKQLQSFIGLCNFYSRFFPQFENKMTPFYMLLQKNTPFVWAQLQQDTFESVKKIFARNVILQHFNPCYQTCLETDSSSYGIGAVLMQRKSNSDR